MISSNDIKLVPDGPFTLVMCKNEEYKIDLFSICASRGLDGLLLFVVYQKYKTLIDLDSDFKLKVVGVDVI